MSSHMMFVWEEISHWQKNVTTHITSTIAKLEYLLCNQNPQFVHTPLLNLLFFLLFNF